MRREQPVEPAAPEGQAGIGFCILFLEGQHRQLLSQAIKALVIGDFAETRAEREFRQHDHRQADLSCIGFGQALPKLRILRTE